MFDGVWRELISPNFDINARLRDSKEGNTPLQSITVSRLGCKSKNLADISPLALLLDIEHISDYYFNIRHDNDFCETLSRHGADVHFPADHIASNRVC